MGCSGGQALCRGVLQAGLLLLATPEASCRSSAAQSVFSACPPWQESRWMPAMAACHTCRPLLLLSDSAAQNPANFCNFFFFLHSFLLAESSCDFFFLWVVFFSPQKIRVIHAALPCPGYPLALCILHAQEAKKSKVECLCAEPSNSTPLCPWLSGAHGASYHENQDLRSPAKG